MYWPGMSAQIEDIVSSCPICNIYWQNNTKEALLPYSVPDCLWSKVGADLLQLYTKSNTSFWLNNIQVCWSWFPYQNN